MIQRGKGRPIPVGDFNAYKDADMTADLARILWDYDPITGIMRWNGSPHSGVGKGDQAGTIGYYGYRVVTFYGKKYKVSRLAFLIMTGSFPKRLAEHKNTDRADDRWENLREATQSQNLGNTRIRSDNKLGLKGVSQSKDGKYHAYICKDGRRKNLGTFLTAESAKIAYDVAALEWHGDFARAA